MEPDLIKSRLELFERLYAEQQAKVEEAKVRNQPINVVLPDGSVRPGVKDVTTPLDIAFSISKKLAYDTVLALVRFSDRPQEEEAVQWDVSVPLPADCRLELKTVDSPEGKEAFWHSSSHILGCAMEKVFPHMRLNRGPPLEDGFFYEGGMDAVVHEEDYEKVETAAKELCNAKVPFQRIVASKEDAIKLFGYNKYKSHIVVNKVPENGSCTVYRVGDFVDPCRGPHIPNSGMVKAFKVTKNSAAYWLNDATKDSLQRIYGISFTKEKDLKDWLHFQEEAAKRDHRRIGQQQELFFFHQLSPGSCFWMPHGARIYERLMEFMKQKYRDRGYELVVTPNIYNVDLWKTSGHWQNYAENMFSFEIEKETFALKPMNCPGHCLMFGHRTRSWRELPLRLADFGVLHRNEFSGALSGLTRVRRFQQDDAHIFCAKTQIMEEIRGVLGLMSDVYAIFDLRFELRLSTRPEKFLGEIETWNNAEEQLKQALDAFGQPWSTNEGDGAFYGPKIDVTLLDALGRKHQCATIQLDFNLPQRFDLSYVNEKGEFDRPVMVHRAIYGSIERFVAVLTEHTAGKWPFWLSPRQVVVLPVSDQYLDYAREVHERLKKEGYWSVLDSSDRTLQKKIRENQLAQYNFLLVIGEKERENRTVNVRTRDNVVHGEKPIEVLLEEFARLVEDHK